jgi:excinuclease ABC subunit B
VNCEFLIENCELALTELSLYFNISFMEFKIVSEFSPSGDQPEAIKQLVEGINEGIKFQTLLGVTGSGKTFTAANVIEHLQRPVLILSHNKTLAAQLYGEFKQFFPNNSVEYFVSYYDYYQPEAYLPTTDTYIEKDLSINEEIEKLRLSATSALLSGRRDVIVVSSVSCLYGIGNPEDFESNIIYIKQGMTFSRNQFLRKLVESLYFRNELEFKRGSFRVKGDTVDIYLAYSDVAYRVIFWGDDIEEIYSFHPIANYKIEDIKEAKIYPANIFVTTKDRMNAAIRHIQDELYAQTEFFKSIGKHIEAKRLEDRVTYDMEMIKELGYCSGIENYSRFFDGRKPGTRPFCLLDFFPDDFLMIIDESHVTVPQIRAMYGGDHSRKQNLVEYGFRLPAAIDNRPLKFEEFENIIGQTIFISATPADYELSKSEGVIVEQVIRPTGLLDPVIDVRPSLNQIDDLMEEIQIRIHKKERVLVTTLTKRMAEELSSYLIRLGVKCRYIHSDIETLERIEIMEGLRAGSFDVLIGVNLLREGLDLPEVSLVAILDADKEGFLRSERSLTQTAGRAARNINGRVIMYADKITDSMQRTITETNRRREKQLKYNTDHNITPKQIQKALTSIMGDKPEKAADKPKYYSENEHVDVAADPVVQYMGKDALEKAIEKTKKAMQAASKELDFIEAARLRDEMYALQDLLKKKA